MEFGVIIMIALWCCDTLKLCSVACTSLPLIRCVNISIMVMPPQTMGKLWANSWGRRQCLIEKEKMFSNTCNDNSYINVKKLARAIILLYNGT